MIRALACVSLAALALSACARTCGATDVRAGSPLALAVMDGVPAPRLFLAQRAVDRAWGFSEDSVYREIRLPEWRSEGMALALSAAVPGSGQYYAGERGGAYLFLLAETAGWVARALFGDKADERREELVRYAGDPAADGSGWSAERWVAATGGDPAEMLALYAADRDAFLRTVAEDDRFLAGWSGDAGTTRSAFRGLRDSQQRMRERQRYAEMGLVLNHVFSAVDALRAARSHNLPLRRDLELRLNGGWRDGAPALTATLRRTF